VTAGAAAEIAGGAIVVLGTLTDVIGTLVVARGLRGHLRGARLFYAVTWRGWSAAGRRIRSEERRERWLSAYGPLSLLTLMLIWLVALLVGWALVADGWQSGLKGAHGFVSVLYFSGTSLLTLGFGDIIARSSILRFTTLAEAITGLGTIALVISYLPALYGAYGRREAQLLTLDDPTGERIQPSDLVTLHATGGDLDRLDRYFESWERWTAEVLESHVSYPMLAYFRSQHPGQSWITALGVVLDAACLTCAAVEGESEREAYFMYRRGRRAVNDIARQLNLEGHSSDAVDRSRMEFAYRRLAESGLPLLDDDTAWARLSEQRMTYAPALQSLIDHLLAPPGFWGHSAEDVAQPAVTDADVSRVPSVINHRGKRPRGTSPS
jgi:cbb3-type cytochrome oxidase subunit 3